MSRMKSHQLRNGRHLKVPVPSISHIILWYFPVLGRFLGEFVFQDIISDITRFSVP